VKNQRVDVVYQRILDHIRAQGLTVIESADAPIPDELRGRAVRVLERRGYDPAKTAADLPISREVIAAVERAHGGEPAVVLPTMGGSVQLWAFTDVLKLPTIVVPYANANNRQHSPNEHLRLDHLFQGMRTTAGLSPTRRDRRRGPASLRAEAAEVLREFAEMPLHLSGTPRVWPRGPLGGALVGVEYA
jgi:acetylornithine deacetylase/succinyl-diaminopimelate desuccinylase-like protein